MTVSVPFSVEGTKWKKLCSRFSSIFQLLCSFSVAFALYEQLNQLSDEHFSQFVDIALSFVLSNPQDDLRPVENQLSQFSSSLGATLKTIQRMLKGLLSVSFLSGLLSSFAHEVLNPEKQLEL